MLDDTLFILGYRPEDDSWETDGRRTYIHDDDATRAWLISLRAILARQGWHRSLSSLRTFWHEGGQIIEIEPGGADCTGHYLHHMKPETYDARFVKGQSMEEAAADCFGLTEDDL